MSNSPIIPPRWADWLLEKLLHGEALEEVQGDLHESFLWRLEERGVRHAKWHFIKEILQSIRLSNLKPYPFMQQFLTLFSSHIKTGWRFIWKTKAFSAINILGLSIGIVFSWFAYQYAADQFSYNKHIKHVDHLYKMLMRANMMGNEINFPGGSYKASNMIVDELPEVEAAALFAEEKRLIKVKGTPVHQSILATNRPLLDYLNLDLLEGEPGTFDAPRTILISEQMAYNLGIRGEAVGQFIELQDSSAFTSYQVLGVYRDIPQNTSIQADYFVPLKDFLDKDPSRATTFINFDLSVLFQLTPGAQVDSVNSKIKAIFKRETDSDTFFASLAPMATFHLDTNPNLGNGFLPGGNKQLVGFILIAGILCLVISIINYANFSISQYVNRSREVAVRKIIGAAKKGVFQQLMTESFLTTLIATFFAVILYALLAPYFSSFVERTFDFETLIDARFIPGNIGLILLISFLSGFYPAVILSRFEIIKTLKGHQKIGKGKLVMQSLLIVQFSISTAMIVCMFVFRGQLDLLLNQDMGRDVTDVVRIRFPNEIVDDQKTQSFLNEVKQLAIIENVTGSSGFSMNPYDDGEHSFGLMNMGVDTSYLNVLGYRFLDGTGFMEPAASSKEVIVNEAFLKKINMNDPIGKSIPFGRDHGQSSVIVGVLQNVLHNAKSEASEEVYFPENGDRSIRQVFLKTKQSQADIQQAIAPIWDDFFYPYPFKYDYLSEEHSKKLAHEAKIAKISGIGSLIAIFIAAFGLLGLMGVTIRQKLKRLSISRVLGAERVHIARMISSKFIFPVLISLALGLATSVYLAQSWLEAYTIRINLMWYHLLLASLIIVGVLILIIWTQVNEALRKNPVIYLKED
ncbi:MAG: FtsX-like permease family protein [Cytophagales bacterium]|nr:FtsX-like permease family protein [Cytophagales bacterium]